MNVISDRNERVIGTVLFRFSGLLYGRLHLTGYLFSVGDYRSDTITDIITWLWCKESNAARDNTGIFGYKITK